MGGTIIKGGKFGTYDPAGERRQKLAKPDEKPKNPKASKETKGPRRPQDKSQVRMTVLHLLVEQLVTNQTLKIPAKIHPDINQEIINSGGPFDWMASQSRFQQIYNKKMHKINKKKALTK